jgi:hypothetical protein
LRPLLRRLILLAGTVLCLPLPGLHQLLPLLWRHILNLLSLLRGKLRLATLFL